MTTSSVYHPPLFAINVDNVDIRTTPPPAPRRRQRPPAPYRPPMFPRNQEGREVNENFEDEYVRRRLTFETVTDEVFHNNFEGNVKLPKCDEDCECTICLSDDNNDMGKLPCGHTFHTNCITQWFLKNKTTCPNCRTVIDIETLV